MGGAFVVLDVVEGADDGVIDDPKVGLSQFFIERKGFALKGLSCVGWAVVEVGHIERMGCRLCGRIGGGLGDAAEEILKHKRGSERESINDAEDVLNLADRRVRGKSPQQPESSVLRPVWGHGEKARTRLQESRSFAAIEVAVGNLVSIRIALGSEDVTQGVGWIDAGQSGIQTLEFG